MMTAPDRAYWLSWYNLPESLTNQGRDDYLQWAHEVYMPKVVAREGVLWGAHYESLAKGEFTPLGGGGRISHKKDPEGVPNGDRYIMIFGAVEAHALANPTPAEFHASLPESDQKMLALREQERRNIMVEEGRVEGVALDAYEKQTARITPAPAIQLGSFQAGAWQTEEEQAAWYARWRLPSLRNLPGCLRVRKLVSVAGWAKHACFYEFTSIEDREKHFVHYEKPNPAMVKWSTDVVRDTVHAPGSANIARRIACIVK